MQILYPLVAGLLTALLLGVEGFFVGAVLGYLVWRLQTLEKKIEVLQELVVRLRRRETEEEAAPADQAAALVEAEPRGEPVERWSLEKERPEEPSAEETVEPPRGVEAPRPAKKAWVEPEPSAPFEEDEPERMPLAEATVPRKAVPQEVGGREPSWLEQAQAFVLGGNTLARVGVVVLFFGFAFLVKYAVDNDYVPIELRLSATALAGIGLTTVGWRLRVRRPDIGLALQGGGVGVLYLSIFAAYRLYDLLPSGAAFGLLVVVALLTAAIAVLQNAQSLAVLAVLGGFFAPVLASTGDGSHVALFSYFAVLNGAVLLMAWFKPWRLLGLVGFACTFGIAALWVSGSYTPALFASTEPFLLLFFLVYFVLALVHARHRLSGSVDIVDGTLVFGLPVAVFTLQAVLVAPYPFGLAWSAFGFGLFYAVAAWALYQRAPATVRMLVEAFAGIGLALATMILPFAADASWTGTGWALEGGALVWLGLRQRRLLVRLAGMGLQIAAAVSFVIGFEAWEGGWPVLNRFVLGCLALSGSAAVTAYLLHTREAVRRWERRVGTLFLVLAQGWWLLGGIGELARRVGDVDGELAFHAIAVFVALTGLGAAYLRRPLAWPALRGPAFAMLPEVGLLLALGMLGLDHPFEALGWLAWPVVLVAHLAILRRVEADAAGWVRSAWHGAGVGLIAVLLIWEAEWWGVRLGGIETIWPLLGFGLVPVVLVLLVVAAVPRVRWPVGAHPAGYLQVAALPLLGVAWWWSVYLSLTHAADPAPLPYLPLFNPLDVVLGLGVVAAVAWYRTTRRTIGTFGSASLRKALLWLLVVSAFVWLNAMLARSVHVWAGVPFDLEALWNATAFQTALSIFWTSVAVTTMAVAARRGGRTPWLVAAGLLGLTVVKLFLVDLSSIGTVARIVTFLVVGGLLVVVGYLAPVPPDRSPTADEPSVPA